MFALSGYCIGILIIIITHVMIIENKGMKQEYSVTHAWLNLGAGFLIINYFMSTYLNK